MVSFRRTTTSRIAPILVLAMLVLLSGPGAAEVLAAPLDSAQYRGEVEYYGDPAPAGMLVSAHVDGMVVATTEVTEDEEGRRVYEIIVPGDDPDTPEREGPADGGRVDFRVHGVPAAPFEMFDPGEIRSIDLTVSQIEICIGAFEDIDADGAVDPGEPLLAGVEITLLQFFVVGQYETQGVDEPSCDPYDPMDTVVRAVDGPTGYEPLDTASLGVLINQSQGVFTVMFPYVRAPDNQPTGTQSPTTTPATPTPTPSLYPGPTGFAPLPTETPTPSVTPTDGPSPTAEPPTPTPTPLPASPTATATEPAPGPSTTSTATGIQPSTTPSNTPTWTATAGPSPTATPTRPSATPSATATPSGSLLMVDSAADPGTLGDDRLTLREAMRLVTGRIDLADLGPEERDNVTGSPGAMSADTIRFDETVFPGDVPTVIEIQPPTSTPGPTPTPLPPGEMLPREPRSSLPPLDTGNDTIDAALRNVVLSAGLGSEMFDGLVLESPENTLRGLTLRSFDTAVTIIGDEPGDAPGNIIGGGNPEHGVVLVENIAGLVMRGAGAARNFVANSYIGVNRDGVSAGGNATFGILLMDGAQSNQIGSDRAGNVVASNFLNGIAVVGVGTARNVVVANRIGTTGSGEAPLGNGVGVVVGGGASSTVIGGISPVGNLISGNVGEGLWIQGDGTTGTLVQGNHIGMDAEGRDAVPNGGAGILISDGATDTFVGGSDGRFSNTIVANMDGGVRVRGAGTSGHTIRRNRILNNAGPGIDLVDGANGGIVTPVITEVDDVGLFSIAGTAPPNSTVDIYSDVEDEGGMFEFTTRADASGRFRVARAFTGPNLTVTATDGDGNTSEFASAGITPTETPLATPPPGSVTPGTPTPRATLDPDDVADRLYLPYISQESTLFARLTIEPRRTVLPMGGMTTLEIRVHDVTGLFGMELLLSYDRDQIQVIDLDPATPGVQIEAGDFPPAADRFVGQNRVDEEIGEILYAFTLIDSPPVSGSGVVARIKLRARGPGRGRIDFAEQMLLDSSATRLPASTRGAEIVVRQPPTGVPPTDTPTSTPSPVPSDTPMPTDTPVPSATMVPSQTPVPSETPEPSPSPTHTPTPEPTETPEPGMTPPTATRTPTASPTFVPTATATGFPTEPPTATETAGPTAIPTEPPTETPTSQPTPTATVTLRPTAGPSPTAAPDPCTYPLLNGGFETGGAWTLAGARPPRYTSAMGHSGTRSLALGVLSDEPNVFSYSSAWQAVRVPDDASTMRVSMWTFQESQRGAGADRQMMLIYDIDPSRNANGQRSPLATVFAEQSDPKAWQRRVRTIDVSDRGGDFLWIYTTVVNDGRGGRTWMFVDDVNVKFCP